MLWDHSFLDNGVADAIKIVNKSSCVKTERDSEDYEKLYLERLELMKIDFMKPNVINVCVEVVSNFMFLLSIYRQSLTLTLVYISNKGKFWLLL